MKDNIINKLEKATIYNQNKKYYNNKDKENKREQD